MIPKIVHYCWFGHNEKPKLIQKCIVSWHKYLPDWKFIEWNEDNFNIELNQYVKNAYFLKKWAFVADYARFDVLYKYGGVYFDTDVELLKPIPDEMLSQQGFTGFQSNNRVNPGLVYGSIPGQDGLKRLLDVYNNWEFKLYPGEKPKNILDAFEEAFIPVGLKLNGMYQVIDGIAIYPNEVFCCYDFDTLSFDIKKNTISIHYYYASWLPGKEKLKQKVIKGLVKILGKKRYKKIKKYLYKNNIFKKHKCNE